MPRFGAHLSIAGGLHRAAEAAAALGCQTLQIFTKNSNQWRAKPLQRQEIERFRAAVAQARLHGVTAHTSYLINLAAPQDALFQQSLEAFIVELERAEALGLDYLVLHPGAHTGSGEERGLARVAAALTVALQRHRGGRVRVLLENTAGQGTTLGYRFEHLAAIISDVRPSERLGVCFDTCHAYAAGYDWATPRGYRQMWEEFDRLIGLERLCVIHVNNSRQPLASRVDRHAHLDQGQIPLEAFRRLVRDRRFRDLPMILETPKTDAHGRDMDPVNLEILRSLLRRSSVGPPRES